MNISKLILKSIKILLWLLDSDHRKTHKIENDIKKFTNEHEVMFYSDFSHASKAVRTVPYDTWEIKTKSHSLICADKHRVITPTGEVWAQDLKIGDDVITWSGSEKITSVRPLDLRVHHYCLEVGGNHHFYTNGILSHNTTTSASYLLWKAMFCPDTQILITANKFSQAMEIMERITYSYEECPNYIRAGVTVYNKGTVVFDNGSKITCRATTPDAGRGLSISLLYCVDKETTVTIRNKTTGIEEKITMEQLMEKMD